MKGSVQFGASRRAHRTRECTQAMVSSSRPYSTAILWISLPTQK